MSTNYKETPAVFVEVYFGIFAASVTKISAFGKLFDSEIRSGRIESSLYNVKTRLLYHRHS